MDRSFRPREHIRRRADFETVYQRGFKAGGRFMTVFARPTESTSPRLGIAATRKLGGAVVRNRAKRLIRELFRHNKPRGGIDVVVVPRRELLDAPYLRIEAEFRALLKRRLPAGSRRPGGSRPHQSV
jgi:ribonuclease P protein component